MIISCHNQAEYAFVLNYLHNKGYKWRAGQSLIDPHCTDNKYRKGEREAITTHGENDYFPNLRITRDGLQSRDYYESHIEDYGGDIEIVEARSLMPQKAAYTKALPLI